LKIKLKDTIVKHLLKNINTYFFLLLAFVVGVSAGAFTVNSLNSIQRDELSNYFSGFLQLLDRQSVDSNELLRISAIENLKLVAVLWALGVTIIGIPFIYVVIGIRGFITGFSAGFVIKILGLKGLLFSFITMLPKEIIIVPCIIALGVSGINFSLSIVKRKSVKHHTKENLKANFVTYCFMTVLFTCLLFAGILLEVYITPVFIRMFAPIF
jgi:stage II sporulation protein M